ncbi:MAG TPA: prepilin-type N-terminal cleavage/methylation domain-containing protein [Candidatus Binatia bacterium]|jgi:prepilin-type N-terminal cleavage/methylation domain-containing protein
MTATAWCRGPRGFTLLELLVATAMAALAAAAFTALLQATLGARHQAADGAEAVAAVAAAIDQVVRDVRLAGYDPLARGVAAVPAGSATSLVVAADLDGDGVVDTSSEEQIGYRVSGDTLERTVGRQTLPLLDELTPGGFQLQYRDGADLALDPTVPGALAAIRTVLVDVSLRATAAHAAVHLHGGGRLLNR